MQRFLDKKYESAWFCDEPEKIENYDRAIADKTKTWICHHRLEEYYTRKELIAMNMYTHRPPEELVFCEDEKEHHSYPHKDFREKWVEIGKKRKGCKRPDLSKYNKEVCSKKVLCVETGVTYNSISDAAKSIGVSFTAVSNVCNGKQKTSGGYHWQFV